MIKKVLKRGIEKIFLNWRLIFILWFINFLFAFTLFFPSYSIFSNDFSRSLIDEITERGDLSILFEFTTHYGKDLKIIMLLSLSISFIYFCINLFLSGGIIAVFKEESKSSESIFSKSSIYFWKFIKLSSLFILIFIIYFIIFNLLDQLNSTLSRQIGSEKLSFYSFLMILVLGAVIFSIIRMLFDYSRIRIVLEEDRKTLLSFRETSRWVLKNFWKTFLLYILLSLSLLLYYIPFSIITFKIYIYSGTLLLLNFLLLQPLFMFRSFLSLLFYSSQVELYKILK
ncbi:MAG: hypothetical protein ACUVUG_07225 [Candidatus Aminicenantia bacterium]